MNKLPRRTLLAGTAGALAALALPQAASASGLVDQPPIDHVDEWGGRPPNAEIPIVDGQPRWIILHHTGSANIDDFSREQAHYHARITQTHGMEQGYPDTAFNFVASRGGYLTEGTRGSLEATQDGAYFVVGNHTFNRNDESIGIAVEGDYYDGELPPEDMWNALVALAAWVAEQYHVRTDDIVGHQDFADTQCPGVLQDMLPEFREAVDELRST